MKRPVEVLLHPAKFNPRRFQHWRLMRGLTYSEVAHRLKVTTSTPRVWGVGLSRPHPRLYRPLAKLLEIPVEELFKPDP